ncbi:hypothetical protein LXL04_005765 [Taraxacum kok-saghyz]
MSKKPYYDAETTATGDLDKREYFIIPSDWEVKVRPINDVGKLHEAAYNEIDDLIMKSIYALAKEQAIELKIMREDDQIKWACIRLEAFKAGWFDNQKFTIRKKVTTATDVLNVFENDSKRIKSIQNDAWILCSFLPYMAEFHFRTFGSTYNSSSASNYVARAQNLATSLKINNLLTYMDNHETLYSKALAWIGVKRPMEVLRNNDAKTRIPSVFLEREKWAQLGRL